MGQFWAQTSPALVNARLSISASVLVSFEPHFGRKIPSKTEFWEPLNGDNVGDIIIDLQNKLCYLFVTLLSLNGSRHPPPRIFVWHRFSLRLPFQKFASSPRQLQRQSQAQSRFPSFILTKTSTAESACRHPPTSSERRACSIYKNKPSNIQPT